MRTAIIIVTAILFLSGCGSQMIQPDGALADDFVIRTVSVVPKVTINDDPFVQTPGDLWAGALAGGLGAWIADGASDEENFIAFLKTSNIDLSCMSR